MIVSCRISFHDCVMYFYMAVKELIKKSEIVNYKVSLVSLIFVVYLYQMNKP